MTGYEYNANNSLGTSWYLSDAGKKVSTHYFYDLAGRISETKDTRGFSTGKFLYDKNNNLTSYLSSLEDDQVSLPYYTKYTYNNMNALTKLQLQPKSGYESGTMYYGYDGLGRLTHQKSAWTANDDTATSYLGITHTYKTATDSDGNTLRTFLPSTTTVTENFSGTTNEIVKYYELYNPDGSLSRTRVTENGAHNYTHFE